MPTQPAVPTESAEPTAPTEAAAPDVANAVYAGSPPPVAPGRRGLPRWAWFLIGGGALLMIAFVVVVVIVVNSVLGAVRADGGSGQPVAAPTAGGTETTPPRETAEPSATPSADAGAGTVTSLGQHFDAGSPFWGFPILDGWDITIMDEGGVNQANNPELGCKFTTSQNRQPAYDLDATDDRSDTEASIQSLGQQIVDLADEATTVSELGSDVIAISTPGSSERLEFATATVEYISPEDGVSYTTEFAARAMPLAEAYLYFVVSCPTSVVDAGDSPFNELRDSLAVVVE